MNNTPPKLETLREVERALRGRSAEPTRAAASAVETRSETLPRRR